MGSLLSQSRELIDIGLRFEALEAGESLNLGVVLKVYPLVSPLVCPLLGEAKSFHEGERPI